MQTNFHSKGACLMSRDLDKAKDLDKAPDTWNQPMLGG